MRIINTIAIPLGWNLPHSPQAGAAERAERACRQHEEGERRLQLRNHHPGATLCIRLSVLPFLFCAIFILCHTFLHRQTVLHLVAPTQSTAHSTGKELWKLSKPTANNSPSHSFRLNNSNCFHAWNGFHFSELSTKILVSHQLQLWHTEAQGGVLISGLNADLNYRSTHEMEFPPRPVLDFSNTFFIHKAKYKWGQSSQYSKKTTEQVKILSLPWAYSLLTCPTGSCFPLKFSHRYFP